MRLLCFGDSNTYGYDPRSYLGGRYPTEVRWVDLLARETGWEILNAGQNGREIPRRAGELRRAGETLSAAGPLDGLVVMLGSNDLLQGQNAESAATRMESFLKSLPSSPPLVLLVAPPPMVAGAWITEPRLLTDSVELATCYEALALRLGIAFADAGQWGVKLLFDGVHFSEAGHQAFAEGIRKALDTAMSGL